MKKTLFVLGIAMIIFAHQAIAAIKVTIQENGANLVVSSSGTLNSLVCTSMAPGFGSTDNGFYPTSPPVLAFGAVGSGQTQCTGTVITPTTGFGTGSGTFGPTNSGVSYYFEPGVGGGFWGPAGWSSSTQFTSSMTFPNTSIASAGLTLGSYVYTFANGNISDTLTINVVVPSPVSTLSEWGGMILFAMLALLGSRRFWRRRAETLFGDRHV
ncbi:MAG TPA: hypothetical protein VFN13_00505 [Rudaea sp.]|nr:hypothetical protein [Rudaea sp.]